MSTAGTGRLLFAFVRHWSRRPMTSDAMTDGHGRLMQAVEAVASLHARQERATVNAVAAEIGIDQSGASRLIKEAAEAGYLEMTSQTVDRRKREASLTDAGREVLAQAHAWQESVFDALTAGWSARRRDEFRRAMHDLITQSHLITK